MSAAESSSPATLASQLAGPLSQQLQACEAKLAEATAALLTLSEEVSALRAAGAEDCEAAIADLLMATDQLQEAFEFVDVLAHNVKAAAALVDATERRLDTLEEGRSLPPSIAQLPPVQFVAHQFSQQLQRRERTTIPELPELSELSSRAEREAAADAAELEQFSELELKLEQMARGVRPGPTPALSRNLEPALPRSRQAHPTLPSPRALPTVRRALPALPPLPVAPPARPTHRPRRAPPTSRARCKRRPASTRARAASSRACRSRCRRSRPRSRASSPARLRPRLRRCDRRRQLSCG